MGARAIFVGGTSSNAGKSWMATAMCAWLRRAGRGRRPVQGAEHVESLVPMPLGRRDRARAGRTGRGLRARAGAGDEPDPVEAQRLWREPGDRQRPCVEDVVGARGTTRMRRSCARHVLRCLRDAWRPLRRYRHRRGGQRQRAESSRGRSGEPGAGDGRSRRHGCSWPTSSGAACSRRSSAPSTSCRRTSATCCSDSPSTDFAAIISLFEDGVRILEARTASHCFGVFPFVARHRA